jgi:hypothetical protein
MALCDYGCGQEAQHYLAKAEKHCCAKHPRNCPEYRKVIAARTTDQMNKASGLTVEQRHALGAGFRFQFWVKDNRARVFDIIDEPLPDFATL